MESEVTAASATRRHSTRTATKESTLHTEGIVAPLLQDSTKTKPQARSGNTGNTATTMPGDTTVKSADNPFVAHIKDRLDDVLRRLFDSNAPHSSSEDQRRSLRSQLVMNGLYTVGRIYAAWSKYPHYGGSLEGAEISLTDYRYTAHHVVNRFGPDDMSHDLAKVMCAFVDPDDITMETIVHTQRRIDACLLAMRKQYHTWQKEMMPSKPFSEKELDEALIYDDAMPITYSIQPSITALSAPSTAAEMLSAEGLKATAEDEAHHSVFIYQNGRVLKTSQAKGAELGRIVSKAREAEKAKAEFDALNTGMRGSTAASAPKKTTVKQKRAVKRAARVASDVEDNTGDCAFPTDLETTKKTPRKRSAPAIEANDGNDAEGSGKKPPPRKRAKAAPGKGKGKGNGKGKGDLSDDSSNGSNKDSNDKDSSGPPDRGTKAPDNSKRGGAAEFWLKDEDDLGHQLVIDNPKRNMPWIYREFNKRLANTAYRTEKMPAGTHGYRSDFIEYPRRIDGEKINDKPARMMDIAWRSYEAVRQHLESHKAAVAKALEAGNEASSVTWEEEAENPVAHLPPRAPPARPTYFKDGITRVPRADGTLPDVDDDGEDDDDGDSNKGPGPARATSVNPSNTPSSLYQNTGPAYGKSSGWTPINKPGLTSSPPDNTMSDPPKKKRANKPAAMKKVSRGPTTKLPWEDPPSPDETTQVPTKRKRETEAQALERIAQSHASNSAFGNVFMAREGPSGPRSAREAPVEDLEDFVAQQSDGEDDDATIPDEEQEEEEGETSRAQEDSARYGRPQTIVRDFAQPQPPARTPRRSTSQQMTHPDYRTPGPYTQQQRTTGGLPGPRSSASRAAPPSQQDAGRSSSISDLARPSILPVTPSWPSFDDLATPTLPSSSEFLTVEGYRFDDSAIRAQEAARNAARQGAPAPAPRHQRRDREFKGKVGPEKKDDKPKDGK